MKKVSILLLFILTTTALSAQNTINLIRELVGKNSIELVQTP